MALTEAVDEKTAGQRAAQLELCRRSLAHFVRFFWAEVPPYRPVVWGWHLQYVCERIQRLLEQGHGSLLICMPVGMGKSTVANVLVPTWLWLHDPTFRWVNIAKSPRQASRDSNWSRQLLQRPAFRELAEICGVADQLTLSKSQNEKVNFETEGGAQRQCFSSGSEGVTGANADGLIVDDVLDASEVELGTPEQIGKRIRDVMTRHDDVWLDRLRSRADGDPDKPPGPRLYIMQRLHPNDPAGQLIERAKTDDEIEVIVIPESFRTDVPGGICPADPRTEPGELLLPQFRGQGYKDDVCSKPGGERKYSTRNDQCPQLREGGRMKRAWLQSNQYLDPPEVAAKSCAQIAIYGDCAGLEEVVGEDYTVFQVWGRIGDYKFILDEVRGRWGIGEQVRQALALFAKWPRARVRRFEKAMNGLVLVRRLNAAGYSCDFVTTKGKGKLERAEQLLDSAEAGQIRAPLPEHAPWVTGWENELSGFGVGAPNDDRWDTSAYAVADLEMRGGQMPAVLSGRW